MDEPYHGASVALRNLVQRLRTDFAVDVVGPRASGNPAGGPDVSNSLIGIRYLVSSVLGALRFQARQATLPRSERSRLVVAYDVYLAGVSAIWARVTGTPFVYLPLDSDRVVSQGFVKGGYAGGSARRWLRGPNERMALRTADLVVVLSPFMRQELVKDGIPERRVMVVGVKRPAPRRDPVAVAEWRRRLKLEGRTGVIFLGSFRYPPNVQAFQFLREMVRSSFPFRPDGPQFVVAGFDSEGYADVTIPNLTVVGSVSDLDGLLEACDVAVAPMDVQGGTSLKMIDYVLHGLRVVATPEATAGVAASPLIHTVARERFVEGLHAVLDEAGRSPRLDPDPSYLSLYVGSDDLREFVESARRLIDRHAGR